MLATNTLAYHAGRKKFLTLSPRQGKTTFVTNGII
jgi:hypothetical protein